MLANKYSQHVAVVMTMKHVALPTCQVSFNPVEQYQLDEWSAWDQILLVATDCQVMSEWLTYKFRASGCSARLSRAQVPAFTDCETIEPYI